MAFGFFKKNSQDSNKAISNIFKKIQLNQNVTFNNRSLSHNFDNEPRFSNHEGILSQEYSGSSAELHEDTSLSQNQQTFNTQNQDNDNPYKTGNESRESSMASQDIFAQVQNVAASANKTQENTPQEPVKYAYGPTKEQQERKSFYTYPKNETYLNEDGRDSGHLYIAPGEPLKPIRKRTEESQPVQTDIFADNGVAPLEDNQKQPSDNADATRSGDTDLSHKRTESAPKDLFSDIKQNDINFENGNQDSPSQEIDSVTDSAMQTAALNTQQSLKSSVSFFELCLLFIRQFVASFFNYTNLGAIFPKKAMQVLGPSAPAFMPFPYFIIGFLCSALAFVLHNVTGSSHLSATIATVLYLLLTGSAAFFGIGRFCTALTLRKIDIYGKAVIVLVGLALFSSAFEYYLVNNVINLKFSLGFGAVVMLSALSGASLNFGGGDDPVSSFGTMSVKGLFLSFAVCIVITYLMLDWAIASSLVGISILSRVVIGQFMVVKGIKTSSETVLAAQFATLLLLMIDIIFASRHLAFVNTSVLG